MALTFEQIRKMDDSQEITITKGALLDIFFNAYAFAFDKPKAVEEPKLVVEQVNTRHSKRYLVNAHIRKGAILESTRAKETVKVVDATKNKVLCRGVEVSISKAARMISGTTSNGKFKDFTYKGINLAEYIDMYSAK